MDNSDYDMCVEYDALCEVEERIKRIRNDLVESSEKMSEAINKSQQFLVGRQYEKAKDTTEKSVGIAENTADCLQESLKYISTLKEIVLEYSKCIYLEE